VSSRRQADATSPGAVRRTASRTGRGESRRPLPAISAGGLDVGLRVSAPPGRPTPLPVGSPTFSVAPRRALGAAWASASSGPGPGSERGGPGAQGAPPPALAPPARA
jgi:hypothetical protein